MGLAQGLQHAEVLPSHSMSLGRQGNRAATSKHGEWIRGIIRQVKPLLLPPLHRLGHGDFEVRIYSMPKLDMNNRTPRECQLRFWVLRMPDTKEVNPQIKLMVNPLVSLTQSHKGLYVQDPRVGQMVQLKAVVP
jgi:hypothetical protein